MGPFITGPVRLNISRRIHTLRSKIAREIDRHMQGWKVLLDESVQFWILFERLQHSRRFNKRTSVFAMQLAKLRSTVISIREVILLGQDIPAHTLTRAFVEDIEVASPVTPHGAGSVEERSCKRDRLV